MKKLLIAVAILALLAWVVSWFRTPQAVATAASKPWPGGLGTLENVEPRYPPLTANDAAKKLAALADPLPRSEAIADYVGREMMKDGLAIGAPPALPDVNAMREMLLHETIVWDRHRVDVGDEETSNRRAMTLTLARALVANALAKAHANDPAAWEDLHAVWNLARSLDGQPPVMMQSAVLTMTRMINAVAWKMPLPAPAWLAELQQRDAVPRLLEAYQDQTASYWGGGSAFFPTKFLADGVEGDRQIAEQVFRETRCDATFPMNSLGTNLASLWHRAFRYRAEREATANAIRIREGKPVETKSVCSDGRWAFDGTTLRFSRDITTAPPDRPMPLVLKLK